MATAYNSSDSSVDSLEEKLEVESVSSEEMTEMEAAAKQILQAKDKKHDDGKGEEGETKAGSSKLDTGSKSEECSDLDCGHFSGNTAGIEKVLNNHRNEIMFELRRLRMGDRPVTGQGNKEAVAEFFSASQNANGPEDCQRSKPEAILVEVQGLVERRPVSSILNSALFRTRLENTVRDTLSGTSRHQPSVGSQGNRHNTSSLLSSQSNSGGSHHTNSTTLEQYNNGATAQQQQPTLQHVDDEVQLESVSVLSDNNSEYLDENVNHNPQGLSVNPDMPSTLSDAPIPPPLRTESWLQQIQPRTPRDGSQMFVWDNLQHEQQETLVSEISELVHQQLVTNTLNSGFGNRLEEVFRDRIVSSGDNGRRVARFVRSLPHAPVLRNDFSHLGIRQDQAAALSDEISVISATAAVHVPHSQNNSEMAKQIKGLKVELAELKNMMKMSMDMQMDIQRSIRQEVAAAISQASGGSLASVQSNASHSRPIRAGKCVICIDQDSDTVLYQCGHLCLCYPCGQRVMEQGAHCPMCRAPVKDILRTYRENI